jgi:hypothetical protein
MVYRSDHETGICQRFSRVTVVEESTTPTVGGAAKILDWFYAAIPRLSRYSSGLREPSETLIRFALYQRM